MPYRIQALLLAAAAAIAAGCTCTCNARKAGPDAAPATRKITLTKGDTISVRVDASGHSTITVEIEDGKPDAGTYTSTSSALLDNGRDAVSALHKPGADVWIRVDDRNGIAAIGNSQKLP